MKRTDVELAHGTDHWDVTTWITILSTHREKFSFYRQRLQIRICVYEPTLYRLCGGGTGIEEEPCLVPCSIDCQMSDWNEWGVCNRLCGPGIHHRYRNVNYVRFKFALK